MSYRNWADLFRLHAVGCLVIAVICSVKCHGGYTAAFMALSFACQELAFCATKYAMQQEQGR